MIKKEDRIYAIDRALDILFLLYHEQKELGITEISKQLQLYKSTVHRTLITLENRGFVQQNPENGKYWLGIKIYALGMVVGEKMPLKNLIQPYAKKLSEKLNEAVNVSILDMNAEEMPKTILILKEEGSSRLKVNPIAGASSESHYSAVGKCLLAFSPNGFLENYIGGKLPAYTENTIDNWDDLLIELEKIRRQGYAIDNEELEIGLTCVGAPILNRAGEAIAAMSVSGPTSRIRSNDIEMIIKEVKATASQVSSLLK